MFMFFLGYPLVRFASKRVVSKVPRNSHRQVILADTVTEPKAAQAIYGVTKA
jgi:hypothetical protein